MNKLLVSPSPHIHANTSTSVLMRDVVIALLPAVLVSILFYGWAELLVLGVSIVSCVLLEYLVTKFLLKTSCTVNDWSAVVTRCGMLSFSVMAAMVLVLEVGSMLSRPK